MICIKAMTQKTRTKSGSRSFARTAHLEIERRADGEKSRFSVSISSDAPIVRRDFDGEFEEVLSHDKNAIDLSRAPLPVIESHDRSKVNIGIVEKLRIERDGKIKKLRGELVLGQQARAQELAADIAAGIVTGLSVGCMIEESEWTEGKDTRRFVATRWAPQEVSIVSTPADLNVGIGRSDKGQTMKNKNKNQTREEIDETGAEHDQDIERDEVTDDADEQVRRYHPASREARAIRGERQRVSTIIDLVSRANLSDSFAQELIRDGIPLREAREIIVDTMAVEQRRTQSPMFPHGAECRSHYAVLSNRSYDEPEFLARSIGEAIHARVNPAHKPSDASHPYIGRSLVELARECLHVRGVSTRMMSASQIIERSLGGLHGTSDFALALGDAVGRELLRAFEAAEPGVLRVGRSVTAQDFRARYPIAIGDAPKLEKVSEHGEFKRGTITEAAQPAWKLQTYGKIFGITRQALINDDLGAFTNLPRRMGIEARELEAQTVVDLLVSNPIMGDSVALFHADHGNLAASGGAITVTNLGAARAAMRLQKSLNGRVINVVPRYLIVPASKETVAEQLLTEIAATKADDVNPFGNGKLELIVEPRLDAVSTTAWYVFGDPGRYDGLEVARLAGDNGPVVDTRVGFDVDGTEFKIRLDFGAGFVEHRSVYKNPGA